MRIVQDVSLRQAGRPSQRELSGVRMTTFACDEPDCLSTWVRMIQHLRLIAAVGLSFIFLTSSSPLVPRAAPTVCLACPNNAKDNTADVDTICAICFSNSIREGVKNVFFTESATNP